jgi:hypothetical protein
VWDLLYFVLSDVVSSLLTVPSESATASFIIGETASLTGRVVGIFGAAACNKLKSYCSEKCSLQPRDLPDRVLSGH